MRARHHPFQTSIWPKPAPFVGGQAAMTDDWRLWVTELIVYIAAFTRVE
jgi:hypothetical protein